MKSVFALTDIQRAIRNKMAFLNTFLKKARSRVSKEAACTMQYICILVLYSIIGWAFQRSYEDFKEALSTQEGGAKIVILLKNLRTRIFPDFFSDERQHVVEAACQAQFGYVFCKYLVRISTATEDIDFTYATKKKPRKPRKGKFQQKPQ